MGLGGGRQPAEPGTAVGRLGRIDDRTERERREALADRARRRAERASAPARSAQRGPRAGRSSPRITRLAVGATLLLVVWLLSGVLLRALESGEILGGTSMGGVDLGGQTREEAAETIAGMEPAAVELVAPQRSFTVRAPQVGFNVDAEASAERAYSAGRAGVGAIIGGPLFLVAEREVEPAYEPLEPERLRRTVGRIADRIDREPFVGALSIDRDTLEVSAREPKAGAQVRRGATRDALRQAFGAGEASIELPIRRQPAPSAAEVRSIAEKAQRYLQRPFRVRITGETVTFPPRRMARVLAIESTGGGSDSGIRLGADRGKVESLVAGLADRRDRQPRNASLDTPAQPPVILTDQGDLTWTPKPGAAAVKKARSGRRVLQGQATDATIGAIRKGLHQARYPTEPVEPAVSTGTVKGATSLLGTFTTSYSCCEPRVTNIQRMAQTVDGTVIGPGEQFSLNAVAGERTRANGYKPAPTIGEDNELIDTVGGGVSQFSTTTYNAAYFAGLQIDAHTPHSFYISRYPPGRESTLNFGTIDLLWTNDTDAPVVVRSSASDTSVTVSIYGGNGGRRVRAVTQSRSDNAMGGFDITIDRVVVYGDGSRDRQPYTTSYGTPAG